MRRVWVRRQKEARNDQAHHHPAHHGPRNHHAQHPDRHRAGRGRARLAACGSSASPGGQQGGTTNAAAGGGSGIHVAKTSLGKVLVDSNGFTVYMFAVDKMNKSNCNAACLHYWPAVKPEPAGMKAAGVTGKFGSTKTPTGAPIATINGDAALHLRRRPRSRRREGQGSNKFGGHSVRRVPGRAADQGRRAGRAVGGYSGGGGGGGGYSY